MVDVHRSKKKAADLLPVLEALVAPETAGDPMGAGKWLRSSLRQMSRRLGEVGRRVSHQTVGRLLETLDYALHQNVKRREAGEAHPDRARQFSVIDAQRQACQEAGIPIISVDTKKKELVGNFKNAGRTWSREPEAVNVHDFPSAAECRAVPYGIYDVARNRGYVCVGSSGDTPAFAVDAIAHWWQDEGRVAYPKAEHLLILADGGGSNGYRPRAWKQQLQTTLSDHFGLTIEVCHYPTGCSKWNPIEHRLFGPISLHWAGIRCAPGRPCSPTSAARPPPLAWRCTPNGSTATTRRV
ncbi:MAG: ISAzo13 family transposase [Chloroflexi bacterium]|nr:MAG: ISAzo13 family transposase [Chloroflexota bacterium]